MKKKIRILYTINYLTNGGPTRVLLNQIYNLNKKEFDIYLLTIIDSNDEIIENELKEYGVKIIKFKMKKNIKDVFLYKTKIVDSIKKTKPDIIHTHGIVTTIILASNKIKSKRVTTIHDNIYEDYKFTYGMIEGMLIAKIHISVLKKFDYIFCCSKASYETIKNKFKNITYIRNGIDVNIPSLKNRNLIRNSIRNNLKIGKSDIVYCYCGVLKNIKRVKELVEFFNSSLGKNEYLLIIGDGPEFYNIKSTIKNKNIIMLGFKKNVIDYYVASDIYTSNSFSEGFSISIIEALSCNLLLLLSEIPSHKECFEIDKTQYIGECFNKDNFANKKEIVSSKVDKSEVQLFYKKNLSANSMMEKYEKFYFKLLNRQKGEQKI